MSRQVESNTLHVQHEGVETRSNNNKWIYVLEVGSIIFLNAANCMILHMIRG